MNKTRLEFRLSSDSPPWSEIWGIDLFFHELFYLTEHQLKFTTSPTHAREICVFSFESDRLYFRTLDPTRSAKVNGDEQTESPCQVGDQIVIDNAVRIEILKAPQVTRITDDDETTEKEISRGTRPIFIDRRPISIESPDSNGHHDGLTDPQVPQKKSTPKKPVAMPVLVQPGKDSTRTVILGAPLPTPKIETRSITRPTGPIKNYSKVETVELEDHAGPDDFDGTGSAVAAAVYQSPAIVRRREHPSAVKAHRRKYFGRSAIAIVVIAVAILCAVHFDEATAIAAQIKTSFR
jgi:hypothetical protein